MIAKNITPSNPSSTSNKPSVLSLAIKEKHSLYSAYMPFVKGGGLFIPTTKTYNMGDEVFMLLSLLDDPKKVSVAGRVVWINEVAQTGKPQGIGVQFNEDISGLESKEKIEALLGANMISNHPTHTI